MKNINTTILVKVLLSAILLVSTLQESFAVGEASTYFEIFVPPNNDAANRDVCLIVTAIFDSTSFTIVDDDMDGDSDDSVSGILNAGQSYVLYLRDNGINDDAPHNGESASKQDGDFFTVSSNNLILASQSTNSDWQHDWVPATNKSSKGKKFIIYSPPTSYSNRDLNVFAYDDNTEITVRKISWASQTTTGYTNVDITTSEIIMNQTINVGEDLVFSTTSGRDILEPGETYLVESSKDVTAQYGALWKNARDGGGYVPSSNGTSSGELFYFSVPYQASNEQEIRIVAWDDATDVSLDKYVDGEWVSVASWQLNALETADWVSYTGNVDAVFRVSSTSGTKISVFEANWLETGSFGTSDIATMASSREGNTAGLEFLVYMAPPGNENNVNDPFTGEKLGQLTHLFLFSREDANVLVTDAYTGGEDFSQEFFIEAGRYVDCSLDVDQWKAIYNGDGNPLSGDERPYLLVQSDVAISVFNTNFNDNWMAYFGTSQEQDFELENDTLTGSFGPADTLTISSTISFNTADSILDPTVELVIQDGAEVIKSELVEVVSGDRTDGTISTNLDNGQTKVTFDDLNGLSAGNEYVTETQLELKTNFVDGSQIPDQTVITAETIISGYVDGVYQQATSSEGITNHMSDQSNLLFTELGVASGINDELTNTWSVSIADVDEDGDEDLLFSEYSADKSHLYLNDGSGVFSASDALVSFIDNYTVVNALTDFNNDGHLDVLSGTNLDRINYLLRNNGNTSFSKIEGTFNEKGYTHGIAIADIDNDGYTDVFVSDYMPTRSNLLYSNNAGLSYNQKTSAQLNKAMYSIGAAFADYDNDGDADLFVPNDKGQANLLYNNNGVGHFNLVEVAPFTDDLANSTGCSWGDYDNDGFLDLFVTNAGNSINFLYRNLGDGSFVRVLEGVIAEDKGDSHGSVWGDFDNDADLDLYVTNDGDQVNFLYLNNGDGTFVKEDQQVVCSKEGNSFSTAVGDLNRDGALDIVVSTHSYEANKVFLNNTSGNNWLTVQLEGSNSNRRAIGAKVMVKTQINGQELWQKREVIANTGGGANAQSSLTCHFGLADATSVDSILIEWPSGYQQIITQEASNQHLYVVEENGALVRGFVYVDLNDNCNFDEGEEALINAKVKFTKDGASRYFFTDAEGYYNAYLVPGDYVLNVDLNNWEAGCATSIDQDITVSELGESINVDHIGVVAVTYLPDLSIDVSTTAFRKGFEKATYVSISNYGTAVAENVTVTLDLDAKVYPKEASIPWDSYSNDVLVWTFDKLDVNSDTIVIITDSVSVNSSIRDEIQINATVSSDTPDLDENNNVVLLIDSVVGSVDPNDILVSPNGKVVPGTTLEYTIRFQNVGNYAAAFVVIDNVLPSYVDESSFKMVSASHSYEMTESEGGVKQWFFDDIQLPDSISNEPESHGYVKYEVTVVDDLEKSVKVYNSADITFDYNDPITTNIVTTTVLYFSNGDDQLDLLLYPNPAEDRFNITIGNNNEMVPIVNVAIFDAGGRTLYVKEIEDSQSSLEMDIDLAPGIYYVKVLGLDGKPYMSSLSVSH